MNSRVYQMLNKARAIAEPERSYFADGQDIRCRNRETWTVAEHIQSGAHREFMAECDPNGMIALCEELLEQRAENARLEEMIADQTPIREVSARRVA